MPLKHVVTKGECISSLAYMYGFFADTLWNDSSNSSLKNKRKDMNSLFPGDEVNIPDKRKKEVSFPSGKIKRFKRKGVPAELRLQIVKDEKEIANAHYEITVDDKKYEGETDAEGNIVISISPTASRAHLIVQDDEKELEYDFLLGHLDSIDAISGVQARLRNLGFICNDPDGEMGQDTIEALKTFQTQQSLNVTGKIDDATRSKLEEVYG